MKHTSVLYIKKWVYVCSMLFELRFDSCSLFCVFVFILIRYHMMQSYHMQQQRQKKKFSSSTAKIVSSYSRRKVTVLQTLIVAFNRLHLYCFECIETSLTRRDSCWQSLSSFFILFLSSDFVHCLPIDCWRTVVLLSTLRVV